MSDNGISERHVERFNHSLLLGRERLREPHWLNSAEIRRLRWLVKHQERVLKALARGLLMDGADLIVYRYMVGMADAQIAFREHRDRARFEMECGMVRDALARDVARWRENQALTPNPSPPAVKTTPRPHVRGIREKS